MTDIEIARNTLRGARERLETAIAVSATRLDDRPKALNPNELVNVGYLTRAACMLLVAMLDHELQKFGKQP